MLQYICLCLPDKHTIVYHEKTHTPSLLFSSFIYYFRDFLGCRESYQLPESSAHDVVLCSTVCDIDHDAKNEVLIGTYGQVSDPNISDPNIMDGDMDLFPP